ncbi:MAG: HD domain-containing phosphohydrolase [Candidatus Omnitrophota bacterium]
MKKDLFKIKSIKNDSLMRKIGLSFLLTSLVPILVVIYILFFSDNLITYSFKYIKLTIALLVVSSLVGFEIIRRIIKSVLMINQRVKAVTEGNTDIEKIELSEEDEIKELALSFNRITKQLQDNIKELEASKEMLQTIALKVSEAITSFEDIDRFINLIIETVSKSLRAKKAKLFLIDDSLNRLFIKASFGPGVYEEKIAIGEGLIGSVAETGKPIIVPAIDKGSSLVAVPLKYANKIVGVLVVEDKEINQSFNNDDLVLLSELATQTASAIENYRLHKDAQTTYIQTISALAMAVEARDPYTRGHCKRMAEYSLRLADAFGLDEKSKKLLSDASVLHDVGKIGISDEILRKGERLTPAELLIVREHAKIGENILKPIASLRPLCDLVRHHHEWLDGSGYPDGLKGDEISLLAKILSVVDAFDAMTSDRPYRKAMSNEQAKEELKKFAGSHFDQEVVNKFIKII